MEYNCGIKLHSLMCYHGDTSCNQTLVLIITKMATTKVLLRWYVLIDLIYRSYMLHDWIEIGAITFNLLCLKEDRKIRKHIAPHKLRLACLRVCDL